MKKFNNKLQGTDCGDAGLEALRAVLTGQSRRKRSQEVSPPQAKPFLRLVYSRSTDIQK